MPAKAFPVVKIPSRRLEPGAVAQRAPDDNGKICWSPLGVSPVVQNAPPALIFRPVNTDDVRDAWHRASLERQYWLEDLYAAPAVLPPMPKDLTARPRHMYVRANNAIGARFATQLASIGRREGFNLVVESRDLSARDVTDDVREGVTQLRAFDRTCSE